MGRLSTSANIEKQMKNIYVETNTLKLPEGKYNDVSHSELVALAFGMGTVGIFPPIGISGKDNEVVVGGRRLLVARMLGWDRVPVVRDLDTLPEYLQVHCRDADTVFIALAAKFDAEEANNMFLHSDRKPVMPRAFRCGQKQKDKKWKK